MKHLFTLIAMALFSAATLSAQNIVGTDPENKNVILEEFTGIHCVFCPDGHAIAQSIYNANPDDVVLINIHTGGYAVPSGNEPDFRTPWGAAIAGQSGLLGYPAGTVNRHLFPNWSQGSGTAMSRGSWSAASNQVMSQPSYLNVGLVSTIVTSTRQLIVEVEVYYTDDSPFSSNYLNVAILQNDILGPQTGGGAGNNYNHKHMLRHLLTGQWGEEITQTTTGSLFSKTYAYELPEDYTDVDVILEDLDIVAFVTETHQEAVSGSSGDITFIESNDYDAAITTVTVPVSSCSGELTPVVELKNYGVIDLTSLEFVYNVNGGDDMTFSWTGNLTQNQTETVTLPTITYTSSANTAFAVNCEMPNGMPDELPQNDSYNTNIPESQYYPEECIVVIEVLGNPEDISWSIVDENNEVLVEGGPYTDQGIKFAPFTFSQAGCYAFTLNDASGEGLSGGFYMIASSDQDILWEGPAFSYVSATEMAYDPDVSVEDVLVSENIAVFPNPVTNQANIEFELKTNTQVLISVVDMLGRQVKNVFEGEMHSGAQNLQMDANDLDNGVYFIRMQLNNEVVTKKIMVSK